MSMTKTFKLHGLSLATLGVLTLTMTACADLTGIRAFTTVSKEAAEKVTPVIEDLPASCKRQYRYQNLRQTKYNPKEVQQLFTQTYTPNDDAKKTIADCASLQESAGRLTQVNAVLVSYLETLSDLAADELTSYDKELEGLSTAISNETQITAKQKSAVENVSKIITKAVTEGYRRKKLKEFIDDTNDAIQDVTEGLKKVIAGYKEQLANERSQMRSFFEKTLLEISPPPEALAGLNIFERITVVKEWESNEEAIDRKTRAADTYEKVLDQIASGHKALKDADSLCSKETRQMALSYAKQIRSLIKEVKEAF